MDHLRGFRQRLGYHCKIAGQLEHLDGEALGGIHITGPERIDKVAYQPVVNSMILRFW